MLNINKGGLRNKFINDAKRKALKIMGYDFKDQNERNIYSSLIIDLLAEELADNTLKIIKNDKTIIGDL